MYSGRCGGGLGRGRRREPAGRPQPPPPQALDGGTIGSARANATRRPAGDCQAVPPRNRMDRQRVGSAAGVAEGDSAALPGARDLPVRVPGHAGAAFPPHRQRLHCQPAAELAGGVNGGDLGAGGSRDAPGGALRGPSSAPGLAAAAGSAAVAAGGAARRSGGQLRTVRGPLSGAPRAGAAAEVARWQART